MKTLLAIAAGGAIGALARHFLSGRIYMAFGTSFPWGILTANVVGSFIMGLVVEMAALHWSPSQPLRAFITVGFLGALTTFSTFALDTVVLADRGQLMLAAVYVVVSVGLSVAALVGGMTLVRSFGV